MLTRTKAALAAALILSTASLGTVSALASDNSGEYSGGFVIQGSTDGVNPVYHRGLSIQNRKGADAFGLAVTKGRTIHAAPATPAVHEDNYGPEAGKD
jgi:hypothetical protein